MPEGTKPKKTNGGARRGAGRHRDQWEELGDIIVSFGYSLAGGKRMLATRAYHSQAGRQMQWEGLAWPELAEWMEASAATFLPAPPSPPPLRLERLELRPTLQAAVQVFCCVRYEGSQEPDPAVEFQVDLDLENLATGSLIHLGTERGVIAHSRWLHAFQHEFPTPVVGRYELRASIFAEPGGHLISRLHGGRLRVER